jgi:N-acetylmuramoyl-L-alanine amidase
LTQPPIPPATQPHPPELRFLVVLDPAHGGADNGAMLAPATPEKDYTLTLATRLHTLLNTRGIRSIFTRDGDTTVDSTARAVAANRVHASACILLHATPTGNGVHLFTSSLPTTAKHGSQDPRRSFLPWQTAQASYGTESLRLESDMNAALTDQHVPVLLDRTALMPLDSLACPAVAIEIAPLDANTPLTDSAYQQKIAQALTAALVAWRSDWRLQP